jgi:hypothetical protein
MCNLFRYIVVLICLMTANSSHAQDLISFQYCSSSSDSNKLIPSCTEWINEQTLIQFDTVGHNIKIKSNMYLSELTKYLIIDSVNIKSCFQDSTGNSWVEYYAKIKQTKCLIKVRYFKNSVFDTDGIFQLEFKNYCLTYKFKYKQRLHIQMINLKGA